MVWFLHLGLSTCEFLEEKGAVAHRGAIKASIYTLQMDASSHSAKQLPKSQTQQPQM